MTTMPQFSFSSPKKVNGGDSAAAAAAKGESSSLGSLTPDRRSFLRVEESQAVLTSPELNPSDSPLPAATNRRRQFRGAVVAPFQQPSEPQSAAAVISGVLGARGILGAAAPPLTNGVNGDDSGSEEDDDDEEDEEDMDEDYPVTFAAPEPLKVDKAKMLKGLADKAVYSFDFSSPTQVIKR